MFTHNSLHQTEKSFSITQGFVDVELVDGKIKEEELRSQTKGDGRLKLMKTPIRGQRKIVAT